MSPSAPSPPAPPASPAPQRLDLGRFRPLGLHQAHLAEDFHPAAPALREELLAFPGWSEMRTNAGIDEERQCGITTGELAGEACAALIACRAFRAQVLDLAADLVALVGGRLTGSAPRVYGNGMAYGQGGWLLSHTDEAPAAIERISWILYLTAPEDGEWRPEDGGGLLLSDPATGGELVVRPRFNRLVVFRNTNASVHAVETVRRATAWRDCRLALSGWVYA